VTRLAPAVSLLMMTCGENRGERCCGELRSAARKKKAARQAHRVEEWRRGRVRWPASEALGRRGSAVTCVGNGWRLAR
jgi:hypothetical protein